MIKFWISKFVVESIITILIVIITIILILIMDRKSRK